MGEVMEIRFEEKFYSVRDDGRCELTDEMDKYLLRVKTDYHYTYMCDFDKRQDGKEGRIYVMRVPGATRGCIVTDENGIIEHINFYEDTCYEILPCYDRKMEEIKDKYIGRKVVIIKE